MLQFMHIKYIYSPHGQKTANSTRKMVYDENVIRDKCEHADEM